MKTTRDGTGVLEACQGVVEQASYVRIHDEAIQAMVAERLAPGFPVPPWNRDLHFHDGSERTCNYVLVLDALNFCFWPDPGKDKWLVPYGGNDYSGYWGLAAALLRSIEGGVPLLDASYLASLSGGQAQKILGGKGEIPMFSERLANLREVGKVLQSKWNGQFARMIEAAKGSAVKLVQMVAEAFSSFNDVARYQGEKVPILKRAQILAVDLFGTFGGESWGRFHDLDKLTAFADYKLPQILRSWGVFEYTPELEARVDTRKLIKAGDPMEVEIRASTVVAVERMRQAINARITDARPPYKAYEVDWYLWQASQDKSLEKPYHLTRTVYY